MDLLKQIYCRGFSRIPIWDKDENDIIGIVFAKDIVYVDPKAEVPLREFAYVFAHAAHRIWADSTLGEALRFFKTGSTHMALVYDVNNSGPVGARLIGGMLGHKAHMDAMRGRATRSTSSKD